MKGLFDDILNMRDVTGVMLFSFEGKLIFKEFLSPPPEEPESTNWWRVLMHSLDGAQEVDLVYEKSRFYIRKTELGYLLVLMGTLAPTAMMRLNCDLLIASLTRIKSTKGLRGLFRIKT
jgi:hypothetical protein